MARVAKQRAPLLWTLVILVVVTYVAVVAFYSRPKLHAANKEEQLAYHNPIVEPLPEIKEVSHVLATKPVNVARPSPKENIPLLKPAADSIVAAPLPEPRSDSIAEKATLAKPDRFPTASSIPATQKHETKREASFKTPAKAANLYTGRPLADTPPIIVGGTDGSGTRGAVALLMSLEVLMLADGGGADGGCQYDVHGKELHPNGWPPVVQRVLASSHSADYKLQDLPSDIRRDTVFHYSKEVTHITSNFPSFIVAALQKMKRAFQGRVNAEQKRPENKHAVRWGFKAPVTVYFLPFWAAVFPNATFVHVVRDGRDMTFHWLQSPVKRYWPHLFLDHYQALSRPQRAENRLIPSAGSYVGRAYVYDQPSPLNTAAHYRIAELWEATNLQAMAVGRHLADKDGSGVGRSSSNGQNEDQLGAYATVRSEDFVTTKARYFEASATLRSIARPDMSDHALCCIASSHWEAEQASSGWRKNVANYGKWKLAVNAHGGFKGDFYAGILKRAQNGLAIFGYLSDDSLSTLSSSPGVNADVDIGSSGSSLNQSTQEWDYGDLGAVNCAAVLETPCPAAAAHQQRCLK